MKLTPRQLIQQVSTAVDPALAKAVVESYVEMQQRFWAGDWKPSELDGGQLCEAVSRCLLQLDTGVVDHSKLPGEIAGILRAKNRTHTLAEKDRQHVMKVVETVYKFRNDRGVAHISPTYTANYMDSMLVLHEGKWIFAEFLRLAWNQDRKTVAEIIEQLVQLEYSLIHELDGKPLVLAIGISAPEEILLLLHHAPTHRLSRSELREHARQKPQTVSTEINRLVAKKEVRLIGDEIALTPPGQQRVIEKIVPKWAPTK